MFAFSVTFKLLSLYLGFRYGDNGPQSRPWILGAVIGLVFAVFDATSAPYPPQIIVAFLVAYLIAALVVMHIYYRMEGIFSSLLVLGIGTAILFFGVPVLIAYYAER